MLNKLFSSTGILTKFALKREIISSTIWIIAILAMTLLIAYAFPNLFESDGQRMYLLEIMQNPAMVAMLRPCLWS